MHDKTFFITVIIFALFLILLFFVTSCRTTGAVVSDNGVTTADVRDGLSDLQSEQADSAAASQRVTDESAEVADGLQQLADTLNSGTDTDAEFKSVCDEIRKHSATAE